MYFSKISSNPTRFNAFTLVALSAIALLLLLVAPSKSAAADATAGDTVTIPLGGKGKGLRVKGARVTAVKPAKIRGASVVIPVSAVTVPLLGEGTLLLRGGFVIKSGNRKVTVQGLFLTIRGGKLTATGKIGTRRVTIFTGSSAGSFVDAATTSVNARSSKLSLTPAGAKQLNKSLRSRKFKRAVLGKLSGSGTAALISPTNPPPGGSTPSSNFDWVEPTPLARPGSAEDVVSATALVFWPRTDFINYVRGGPGTVAAESPAFGGADVDSGTHICATASPASAGVFSFHMPFVSGWWDAVSSTGAFTYSGSVRFTYPDHGIDIRYGSAEVEFNHSNSQVIFRMFDPDHPAGKRGAIITLPELASSNPVDNGTLTKYLGSHTEIGSKAIGGFYIPPAPFGCIQMGFSAP